MSWHQRPKDNAWRQATLASARRFADRLWLYCNGCHRSYLVMHDEFVAFHQLESATTFPAINKRLRCVVCGEKKGQCRSESHGSENQRAYPVVCCSPAEGPQPVRRTLRRAAEPRRPFWPLFSNDDVQIEF